MRPMLVTGFPAGTFQTNCWLVATAPGSEALVVDPGQDALAGIEELCRRHRLKPVAALLTHGHLDHVWTVAPLAGAHGIPAFVHPADRHLLTDPLAGFGPDARAAFAGLTLQEPDDVRELADGQVVELAGLRLTVDHTPGHTPGHVTFRSAPDGDQPGQLLAGDLVFAGSIGRTDLPGGSTAEMLASLASRFLPLPDETQVLPGHGPTTTVGRERATNPFLAGLDPVDRGGPRWIRGAGRERPVRGPQGHLRPPAPGLGGPGRGRADHARAGPPGRLPADRDADLRGHGRVRPRGRRGHRRRPEGDVHLQRQGRPLPHPAPGADRRGGQGADRARPAHHRPDQGRLLGPPVPLRAAPGRPPAPVLPGRHRGHGLRRPGHRRRRGPGRPRGLPPAARSRSPCCSPASATRPAAPPTGRRCWRSCAGWATSCRRPPGPAPSRTRSGSWT